MNDIFLSVFEPAFSQWLNRRAKSGPAGDAQREGLPIDIASIAGVAIIPIIGPMLKSGDAYYGEASTRNAATAVSAAAADDDIHTQLIVFDTPGGSVSSLDELGDAIEEAAKKKRVIAQVDGMLASAGYYAASHATEIRAGAMDLVGSIGTRIMLYDYSKMFEASGIKAIPVDTGEFKSAGAPGTEITPAQIADFQHIVDGYFADFSERVRRGRGMSQKQFDAVADGRVFFGHESIEKGLIDRVATLRETITELSQKTYTTQNGRDRLRLV